MCYLATVLHGCIDATPSTYNATPWRLPCGCIKFQVQIQKTYCADFLTKRMKKNEGEVPQYYVEGSHPAIVSPELFDHVQWELRRRKGMGSVPSTSCFAGRIICGECGSVYGSKVWHSTSKYRRTVWQCNGKFKGEKKCTTPHLYEKDIQQAFVRFVNGLIADREEILAGLQEALVAITDNTALERERDALQAECEVVMELMRKMVQENARTAQDQSDYTARYATMTQRYDKANQKLAEVEKDITARSAKRQELEAFMRELGSRSELLTCFDEGLWLGIVHQVRVTGAGEFEFVLKSGPEVRQHI